MGFLQVATDEAPGPMTASSNLSQAPETYTSVRSLNSLPWSTCLESTGCPRGRLQSGDRP